MNGSGRRAFGGFTPLSGLFLLACVATLGVGLLSSNALPLIIGTLVDSVALSEAEAGLVGSYEMAAVAVAAGLLAFRVHRLSKVRLALAGSALVVAANLVSSLFPAPDLLPVWRCVAGAGAGCALAAGNAAIAGHKDPDRIFALVTFFGGLAAAALLVGLSWVTAAGFAALTLVLAGISLVAMPPMVFLAGATATEVSEASESPPVDWTLGWPVLAALFLISVGEGAIWAYSERIGNDIGMAPGEIGSTLAGATLLGLGGAAFAAWLGLKAGRAWPLFLGLSVEGVGCLVIGTATEPSAYIVGQLLYSAAFLFVLPYLMGTSAAIDPAGRVATAASSVMLIAMAFAPGVGGFATEAIGYPGLGMMVCMLAITAALALVPTLRRLSSAEPTYGEAS